MRQKLHFERYGTERRHFVANRMRKKQPLHGRPGFPLRMRPNIEALLVPDLHAALDGQPANPQHRSAAFIERPRATPHFVSAVVSGLCPCSCAAVSETFHRASNDCA